MFFLAYDHIRYLNRSDQIQTQATLRRENLHGAAGLTGISADQFCNGKRVTANYLHTF